MTISGENYILSFTLPAGCPLCWQCNLYLILMFLVLHVDLFLCVLKNAERYILKSAGVCCRNSNHTGLKSCGLAAGNFLFWQET